MTTIYDHLFPLGIGTNRFAAAGPEDTEGIDRAAQMVASALEAGASYIDVAQTYSRGTAMEVCRQAFTRTKAPRHVTVKSSFLSDKTADDALRRTEAAFANMGIEHAFCFVIWNISSYAQFEAVMRRGSLYEGACLAKERGLVDHICFSTHAPPQDIVRILNTGAFEGVTISFSALNSAIMRPVLDCAEANGIGVVVMNPLGGGLIPQQKEYFSFLQGEKESSTVQAALRYVYAHPAVKVVLSGMNSQEELSENLDAFQEISSEKPEDRIIRVNQSFQSIEGFCTGCRYCDGCPQGIPIFELMQAHNTTLFPQPKVLYGRTDPKLIETMGICSRLKNTFGFLPSDAANPCVKCGRCEAHCTAHLPIMERLEGLYRRFSASCFSRQSMLERLRSLIGDKRKIAFYPGGGYTAYVLALLKEAFPGVSFKLFLFDSNSKLWGTRTAGVEVRGPDEIEAAAPELVVVSNYNYSDEIYGDLVERLGDRVPVARLHEPQDVPWVF